MPRCHKSARSNVEGKSNPASIALPQGLLADFVEESNLWAARRLTGTEK
jgi:hypothetical protein